MFYKKGIIIVITNVVHVADYQVSLTSHNFFFPCFGLNTFLFGVVTF